MTGKTPSVYQIKSIYIVTTLFLVGLSVYSFILFNGLFKASREIYHTHNVRGTLEAIASALLDAESSTRGYTMTGDSSLLQRKDKALQRIWESQKTLDSLIADDQQLMRLAISFNLAVDEKIRSIQHYANLAFPPSGTVLQQARIEDEISKMESVNVWLITLTREEASIRHRRTELFSRLSVMAPVYIIVLFLGALLILFYSYYKVYAALAKSRDLHDALVRQSISKESLAGELIQTNHALAFQNEEKEKRAAELVVANEELAYQNKEKESRAADLIIANEELAFQNEEKEKRAMELLHANKELELFLNISSHDLQEPLRKIQMAASRIEKEDYMALSPNGRNHFEKMQEGALSMQTLMEDLMTYARAKTEERKFGNVDVEAVIHEILENLKEVIAEKNAVVEVAASCNAIVIPFQFRQMLHNIITNALKFTIPGQPPRILISARLKMGSACQNENLDQNKEYCHIRIADNGIGFEPEYKEKIFEVFQRLSGKETYKGTGIGLAIVKRIVENHGGLVAATGQVNEGATFDVYLPTLKVNQHA